MNRALRCDDDLERARLWDQARAKVDRGMRLGQEIEHAVIVGECEFLLAALARIQGHHAEHRRLTSDGRRRFTELGIRRKGRAEQFVVFAEPIGPLA
jgi:hypothetical protein